MKKIFFLYTLLSSFFLGIYPSYSHNPPIEGQETLQVLYSSNIPPYIYEGTEKRTIGISIEWLQNIVQSSYTITPQYIPLKKIEITPEIPAIYIGTRPSIEEKNLTKLFVLNTISLLLFYNTDAEQFTKTPTIEEISSFPIGFVNFGIPLSIIQKQYPTLTIREFPNIKELQKALEQKKLIACILPEKTMQYFLPDSYWKALDKPLLYFTLGAYTNPENTKLIEKLSSLFAQQLLESPKNLHTSFYLLMIALAFLSVSLYTYFYYLRKKKHTVRVLTNETLIFPKILPLEYFFCTLDAKGIIQSISQEVEHVLGYAPKNLLHSNIQEIYHNIEIEKEYHIDFSEKSAQEIFLLDKSNTPHTAYALLIKTVINTQSDPLYEYIIFDTTVLHTQYEEIYSCVELYQTIFANAPIGVVRFKEDGSLIHTNPTFEKMVHKTSYEIANTTIFQIFPKHMEELLSRLDASHPTQERILFLPKTQKYPEIYFMAYATKQSISQNDFYIDVFLIDITETETIKKNAEESSEHLHSIIDFLPYPTFIIDKNKRIIMWNKALEKLSGISAKVMIGKADGSYSLPFYGHIRPMACDSFFEHTYTTKAKEIGDTITLEAFCPALGKGTHLWISASVLRAHDSSPIAVIQTMQDITQQKEELLELEQSKKRYSMVLEASNEGIWEWSATHNSLYASSQCYAIFALSETEKITFPKLIQHIYTEDIENVRNRLALLLSGKLEKIELIFRIRTADTHKTRWVQGGATTDKDATGTICTVAGSLLDITERKEHENITRIIFLISNAVNITREPKELFQSIHTILMRYVGYKALHVALWNETEHVMEYPYYFDDIYSKDDLYTFNDDKEDSLSPVSQVFKTGKQLILTDTVVLEGEETECVWLVTPLRVRNSIIGVIATHRLQNNSGEELFSIRDKELMTAIGEQIAIAIERYNNEEQLTEMALHDPLTGLPNRVLMSDRLEHAIRRVNRSSEYRFAVFMLDLDRFKLINDTYGHNTGDLLLIEVANRIQPLLRSEDTVARLGGDEFAIILENIHSTHEVLAIAKRILRAIEQPLLIDGKELRTATSIGIVLDASSYDSAHTLLRDADIAMYDAKTNGKGRFRVFDQAMHQQMLEYVSLETDLAVSIEQNQLYLNFQPIVDTKTHSLLGFEALVRWKHPEKGIISPIQFIGIAEENGFIIHLGNWVLEKATATMQKWVEAFPEASKLTISVNLSAKQAVQTNLTSTIQDILAKTQLIPAQLKLEVTETTIMSDPKNAMKSFKELRELGIHIAIDDFGSGYSSMTYLQKFPVDTLKIDRTFIVNATATSTEEGGKEIIRAICALAHGLGLDVVAEGVETQEQLDIVLECACNATQGYFFSKPLSEEDAFIYLTSSNTKI